MNHYKWCNVRYGSEPGKGDNIRWLTPSGLGAGDPITNMGSGHHDEVGRVIHEHNGAVDELGVEIKRLKDRIEQLEQFVEFVRAAPVASGVCCCGGNMDHYWDGHSPVDQWDHSLGQWLKELGL